MKTLFTLLLTAVLSCLQFTQAAGFTDAYAQFYGEVRQVSGGQTALLQSGELQMTFVNQANPDNRVTLSTSLRPTGSSASQPWSYSIDIPLAYLPEPPRLNDFLAIGATQTNFTIEEITIDGGAATLPDGSKEFYSLSFASRAEDYRLDLIVQGNSEDADLDGMPDWWELIHGLDPSVNDAEGDDTNIDYDLDNDGWSNLEEYIRGSNPTVSNLTPQLVTTEISVPESGQAGVYIDVFDSDSTPDSIILTLGDYDTTAFTLLFDNAPLTSNGLTLTDLQFGRLTIRHTNRSIDETSLALTLNDGTGPVAANVLVHVASPSTMDGNDSSLWLDGKDLALNSFPLTTWVDRSGHGRNASQPLPAHQPIVSNNSADFSKSANAHLLFQDAALPSGDHTILAAYHPAETSDAPQTLLATNRGFLQLAATTTSISYPGAPVYQMDNIAVRGYKSATGQDLTSIFRRQGSQTENIFGLTYNGETTPASTISPLLPTLGARRSALPSNSDPIDHAFNGQLRELLIFPSALAEQKLRDVHDYLQSKWSQAVIWDLSTELNALTLNAISDTHNQIIRGGHANDILGGGSLDDTLSGGPGDDILIGGLGNDRFVFGGVDTGNDSITDFDLDADTLDLSALFWNHSGDARDYISIRLDADFSTETPTLNSVLIVQRPGSDTPQEIVLENTVIGQDEFIQLITEGQFLLGGLTIPTEVKAQSTDQTIIVTRSGPGVAAAIDVPLSLFQAELGDQFILSGADTSQENRPVLHFARGETQKTLSVRPVPSLEESTPSSVSLSLLPNYKYASDSSIIEQTISTAPTLKLQVTQRDALADTNTPATVLITRDGDLTQELTASIHLAGNAQQGVHIDPVPATITFLAGEASQEVQITAIAEGIDQTPRAIIFQIAPESHYQRGAPHEALLYVANNSEIANRASFDSWLNASTQGAITSLADLKDAPQETVDQYLKAYAFGLNAVDSPNHPEILFSIVDDRPQIVAPHITPLLDISWTVVASQELRSWNDVSDTFEDLPIDQGIKLAGPLLTPDTPSVFYRLNASYNPSPLASDALITLTQATRFGLSGNANWTTDPHSGALQSTGSDAQEISHILAEVTTATTLHFQMEITDANDTDHLTFYINGEQVAETTGAPVTINQEITPTSLLMWEFKKGTGSAQIQNLK